MTIKKMVDIVKKGFMNLLIKKFFQPSLKIFFIKKHILQIIRVLNSIYISASLYLRSVLASLHYK